MTAFFTSIALSNHQVALVICRALHALGAQSETDLRKMLVPPSEAVKQWEDTMAALIRTRVIIDTDGQWELTNELSASHEVNSLNFGSAFLKGLTTVNLDGLLRDEDPDDFFKALLWLSELPANFTYSRFDDTEAELNLNSPAQRLKVFGIEDAINRVDQWRPFQRWLRGLGLIKPINKELNSVDISGLVLSFIANNDIDGPLDLFVTNLAENLPMFCSANVTSWYEKSTGIKREYEKINQVLGLALFVAEEKNLITFYTEDDAKVPTLTVPFDAEGNARLFTHIRKGA